MAGTRVYSPGGIPIGFTCQQKTLYRSRKDAAWAAATWRRLHADPLMRAYHCEVCHGHHIGHPTGSWGTLRELGVPT